MPKKLTYASTGVDRELRAESKAALHILDETYRFSRYGKVMHLPYGNIFPVGENRFLDLAIEGVGTKVLIAQLIEKYDTIGVDGVAMAINDVIRSGARPLALADNIHAQISNPKLVKQWLTGIARGATEAQCPVPGGEIGDVADLIKGLTEGRGFDMVVSAVGEVERKKIISGNTIKPGDVVVGLRSSGIHSNGISLARRILFKQWGGKYAPHDTPEGLEGEVAQTVLEPTRIYVKPLMTIADEIAVKGAVHITGDAYLKFGNLAKFSKGIGFEFDDFSPQPIFGLIKKTALELGGRISDEEMFKTFNMGWGFAIIVDKKDEDKSLDILERAGAEAQKIGRVTRSEGIVVLYRNKKIVLK